MQVVYSGLAALLIAVIYYSWRAWFSAHVQRQREEWDAFRGWQLDLGARRAQGDSAVFGNREQGGEFSLATPLIGDFWRVYAQAQKQDADIPEGTVAYERNGLGLRYDHAGVDLRAAWFTPQDGHSQRDAFETALRWRVSDRWWLGAQTSSASRDAPLRGRYYGITARSYALGGGWQRNERSDLSLHLSRLDFSDGNQRDSAALAWREQVITQPHLKLDLHGEFAASRNSLGGGPYFNPELDRMGLLGGVLDWMSWRRYENRWNQRLGVWAGRYWQQDYGSSGVLRTNSTTTVAVHRSQAAFDLRQMAQTSPSTSAISIPSTTASSVTPSPRRISGQISQASDQFHIIVLRCSRCPGKNAAPANERPT